jgi:Acetyltransferase (GNAT) domain
MNLTHGSFRIVRGPSADPIEGKWRACLADSDFPTHYTAPEFFLEPAFRGKSPFAILSLAGDDVMAVLTGTNVGGHIQSGLSVRPQLAFSRRADRAHAMGNLLDGVLQEAKSAKLVDLFVWSDMARLVDPRFNARRYEGVVMLDLSLGPDALFRRFSENKRTNIKKAIKHGISVDVAKSRDEISAFFSIYADWSHRKSLPMMGEAEFHETFALTTNRRLFLARHNGQVVAGVVIRFFPGGVMEYAANNSLESALRLRPNDLLHWRAIEWACAEGLRKYSLGGAHLFLRKFGGDLIPTTRHRLDLSTFRRFAIGDWIEDRAERARPLIPEQIMTLGRSLRSSVERLRILRSRRAA